MKTYAPFLTLFTLFFILSCQEPALKEPSPAESHPGIITTVKSARTANYLDSDLTGQWRMKIVDLAAYGYHTYSNNTCLNSTWLYFGPADNVSGDVIQGSWTTTNESCPEAHTGQQLFDTYGNPYSTAFELWSSLSGLPQRYSFNKSTGVLSLARYVSSGSALTVYVDFNLSPNKQTVNLTSGSALAIFLKREPGGPSVP